MITEEVDIDQIVRRVLAALDDQSAAPSKPTCALEIDEQVVSAQVLPDDLKDIRELVVPASAVITPAAHDLLRAHQVVLTRATRHNTETANGTASIILGAAGSYEPSSVIAALADHGIRVDQSDGSELIQAVERLIAALADKESPERSVLLTDEAAAALCLANRRAGVRAIEARDIDAVRSGTKAVGANMLIIAPRGHSLYKLVRMIKCFADIEPACCPAAYQTYLT